MMVLITKLFFKRSLIINVNETTSDSLRPTNWDCHKKTTLRATGENIREKFNKEERSTPKRDECATEWKLRTN